MKRTAIVAITVVALVLGLAAYAVALDQVVTVTARVNPAFSMTIDKNAVDFTGLNVGDTASDSAVITVKSNKLWNFSKTSVVDPLLVPVLTESGTTPEVAVGKPRGVRTITAGYAIDLTTDAAYDLLADTDYLATYTYTAVQQ
ncbi:MAG: hypothetical protein U1E29_00375 [Coriobacteriia bacterium]|nr:hypothetical protein [Coriobacteriia bacterium]